ncbi:MAG: dipeptide ABC transporter ATP-binding protein [Peptococcaceae bacterium]|jgi:oligopeptide/dipeptide ABC transporter ATP-binding protein|nr:dipeptide ABC transporter ATP-binding protein [Peptococcaceae bacterium]
MSSQIKAPAAQTADGRPADTRAPVGAVPAAGEQPLVEVDHIVKEFRLSGGFRKDGQVVHAVTDVSLDIYRGETLAVVGESGCGKSTLGRLILRLLEPTAGSVRFRGRSLEHIPERELRQTRRQMQIIFQDPYASLNPRMTVCQIIAEPLYTHKVYQTRQETEARVKELMRRVGIRAEYINRYPHQFSGGQRQRIGIARALALNPELIICDEPVSALDVSIQAQILNLLHDLQAEAGLTYLFISHDLSVVRYVSNRVCVMFLGKVCELGDTEDIFQNPLHPYTKFLLEAVPKPNPHLRKEKKALLTGEMPSPVNPPAGCRFHTRCPLAMEICTKEIPATQDFGGRLIVCHQAQRLFKEGWS